MMVTFLWALTALLHWLAGMIIWWHLGTFVGHWYARWRGL